MTEDELNSLARELADAALDLAEKVRERNLGFGDAEERMLSLTRADDAMRAYRTATRLRRDNG